LTISLLSYPSRIGFSFLYFSICTFGSLSTMVNFRNLAASLAAASAIGSAVAHPGEIHTPEEVKREIVAHKAQQVKARRSLADCANSPAAVALKERAVARRAATAQKLREQRGLTKSQ
jgi:hypothetical protein